MKSLRPTRREFLQNLSLVMGSAMIVSPLAQCAGTPQNKNKMQSSDKKLGIALVGLGGYSSGQLAPALHQTKHCYLAGIVTGTPSKEKDWADRYTIPKENIYNYQSFDSIADNKAIDIVYVVLPISMHREFTIRAAKAGKHVICEKPMALNVKECSEMIEACKNAKRMLSIGYRLHFEPHNIEMMRLGQKQIYGPVKTILAENGYTWGTNTDSWRLKKNMAGGGGLMDMGVYAIQGARYTTGEEPVNVTAREEKLRPDLFKEVDETIYFTLEFPGGAVANGVSSYNKNLDLLKAVTDKGWFQLGSAYRYGNIQGSTHEGPMLFDHNVNQQALQMDDFAQCITQNENTRVPGDEGLKDMKVIEAIYRSIASGKKEKI